MSKETVSVYCEMKMWTEIRRLVLDGEESKRAICQEYGIHWKTLEKILAHEEPPGYRQKERPTPVPVRAKACTAKSLPRFGGSSQSNASALSLSIVHFFTSSSAVRRTAALATASNARENPFETGSVDQLHLAGNQSGAAPKRSPHSKFASVTFNRCSSPDSGRTSGTRRLVAGPVGWAPRGLLASE